MPAHFNVAAHDANPVRASYKPLLNADELLANTWGAKAKTLRSAELLQTSLHAGKQDFSAIHGQHNGFVNTVTTAYNEHHHLILRPDDVWIAILGQFNFYVNAHAEELRHHFVKHEGKKELTVEAFGTRYTVNFGDLAKQMSQKIHENVVDKGLKDWILPDFSTSSHNDTVVCAVLMMATLKAYFSYTFELTCGIPSVTLEGEKSDWEKLLSRIDKLNDFGPEPAAWATLLRPILTRFVKAFDGEPDLDFWGRVCHYHSGGSGPTYLSGWVTAFCVWSNTGEWQGPSLTGAQVTRNWLNIPRLTLDGVEYSIIDSKDVPTGFCEVDVKLDDNGQVFDCMMVSGHLATIIEGEMKDSVRPLPSWFMFIKEECEDPEQVEIRKLMKEMEEKYPAVWGRDGALGAKKDSTAS
ncbi:hypothetical protein BDZ97DRAFT_1809483 [Flammula alnicola]|nr:hypothetical protein BDZ97DRAFT_1809483 [Flammula alnicola]